MGRFYNGETFYGAGYILIRWRHINSVIISPRPDFSWGRHFNVTPAALDASHVSNAIKPTANYV